MSASALVSVAVVVAVLSVPAGAGAAAPANDAPAGAIPFATFTAENGVPTEQQAEADLAEATPDAGVPRCLGSGSFARTVWFTVPAADVPRRVRVEALSPSLETAETPDVAAFVQPMAAAGPLTAEPQACDGAGKAGGAGGGRAGTAAGPDPGAGVELRVPAGRVVLVQIGRRTGQRATRVVASLRLTNLPSDRAPRGDVAKGAPVLRSGTSALVALGGATLTQEDPAQPACPASGTVWRRFSVPDAGRIRVAARGAAVSTLTLFRGSRPTGTNAVACANRGSASAPSRPVVEAAQLVALTTTVARPGTVWLRVGTDAPGAGERARVAVAGVCDPAPFATSTAARRRPSVRVTSSGAAAAVSGGRRPRVKVRVSGGCLRGVRVTLTRAGGGTVATGTVARVHPGTRTLTLRRGGPGSRGAAAGRYRLRVVATAVTGGARVTAERTVVLG
ncbi:hypothetical protein DSM112329_01469 [Paraconexibacter sp. AEG42_29]|uniref:Ig-like domain repeat protein n=1 Tax=Paraconexibacter sp. AEG42_29 TaxID=2997339 RepID=A0AAU7ASS3_9ACTN